MNLIRKLSKWYDNHNENKSFLKTGGVIFGILFIISTLSFINFMFNVDIKEENKVLSNVMEENRSEIEELITRYEYGNFGIGDKCHITFSEKEVSISSYKEYFFIGRPEINYSVVKIKDSFFIDERYTEKEYIFNSITVYFLLIILCILVAFLIIVVLVLFLDFCAYQLNI